MEFKKKLKIRMFVGIALIVLGVAMIVIFNVIKPRNEFLSSFGFAFAAVGVVRLKVVLRLCLYWMVLKRLCRKLWIWIWIGLLH